MIGIPDGLVKRLNMFFFCESGILPRLWRLEAAPTKKTLFTPARRNSGRMPRSS
jgi:hypothetical protein